MITAALATTLSVGVSQGGGHAALDYDSNGAAPGGQIGDLTRFQIDGDPDPATSSNTAITNGPGVTGDWSGAPYGPQPIGSDPTATPPTGIGSSGILPLLFAQIKSDDYPTVSPSPNPAAGLPGEPAFCDPAVEDVWAGGEKVDFVNIDNPLFNTQGLQALECGNATPGKGDLFSVYAAYETVAVPNVYGDPNSGSENHVIIYGAWERGEVPGELNFYIPISDGVAGNSAGDRLIAFDYDSSSPASFRILSWNGTGWIAGASGTTASSSDVFAAAVGFADGTDFTTGSGARPSFGEFALDLTATGIIPDGPDAQCIDLETAGFVFTETGNSGNASLTDYVGAPKIPISNCSSLSVTKAGPADTGSTSFDYRVEQQDSLAIFPVPPPDTTPASLVNQINNKILIGETQTWTGIFAEPDYVAFENPIAISGAPPAPLPTGWEMVNVDCTYVDGFNPAAPPYLEVTTRIVENGVRTTDANGDLTVVQVHSDAFYTLTGYPGYTPSCTITNDAAGVIIEKAGTGDLAQDFTFDANGQAATLKLTESTFLPFGPSTSVTITEADPGTTPGWDLASIECTDSSGVVGSVDLDNRQVTITTNGSDDKTTCVFTNNQSGRLIVEKVGAPDGSSFDFTHDIPGLASGSGFSLAIPSTTDAGAFESGDIAPGTYTVNELLAAVNAGPEPDVTGSAVCSGETPVAGTTGDVVATVTIDPGETATCTFSNTQNGRIIVEKSTTNGDGTFTFDLPGSAGDGSISTTNGTGTTTLVTDVVPGTDYSVEETIPAGWDLDSATCVGDLGATGTLTNGEDSASIDGIAVAAGETVTCSFTNSRETATLNLTKSWGPNAASTDSVTLEIDGDDLLNAADHDDSGSSTPLDTTPASLTIYPGETVGLEEIFGANTGDYLTNLTCDNALAGTLTYTALDLVGSFDVVADDPQNVTCTFANTRTAANVTLEKVWVNGFEGDLDRLLGADTTQITATSTLQTDSTTSTAGETTASSVTVSVLSGATVDLSESFGTNTGSYTTDLECLDPTGQPVAGLTYTDGELSGTYTMPMTAADVTCTFTNTRTLTDLTLTKSWTNPATGDSVDLAVTGEAGTGNGTNSGDGVTTDDATLTVYSGEELDLSEAFNPGDATWYNTSLECGNVGSLTYTTDALAGELVVPTADADGDGVLDDGPITCTFSNVRRTANVVVVKDIVPDSDGGLFNLSINGGTDVTNGGDGASSAPVQVLVGDPVTVSESAGTGTSLANYTPTLACPSVTLSSNTGSAGGFTVPNDLADDATITCTFTNTRKSASLTLTKDWVNGAADDAVSLVAGGDSGNSVDALGSSTAPDADSDAVLTIWAGEQVTLSETYVPANVGSYTAALACADAAGAPVALPGYTAGDLQGTYDVPSTPVDVTCTFTNTRTSAELTLRKAWVNGNSGDTADLDVTNQLGQTPADGNTSTSDGTIGIPPNDTQTDTTNVVTATVLSGEQVTLDELLGAGNVGAYTSELDCGNGVIGTTTGSYTMPKTPADATCTFTNTRTSVTLTVDNVWVDAVQGDTTEITVTGDLGAPPAGSTATGAAGSQTDSSVVSLTVLSGETVQLSETVDDVNNTALYTSVLECDDVELGTTSGQVTVAKDATADISCVFTNTARRGSITIIKNVAGETDTFSFEGSWPDTGVTTTPTALIDPADFTLKPPANSFDQVTFSGVLVPKDGQPYSISEIDPGVNFGTTITCTGDTVIPGTASGPATATAGLTGSIGLDDGEHITCVFNNTQYGIVTIEKVIANAIGVAAEADFSFTATGLTPAAFDLDDDAGDSTLLDTQTYNNVVPGGDYTVTETVPAGWALTGLVCDDGQSATPSTTDGATATIKVDPAEVVRCTYTNTALESDVQVTKTVAGVTDAIDWSFAFTITPNDTVDAPATVPGEASPATGSGATTDTVGWSELVPGASYTITETTPNAGYTAGALTCNVADTDGDLTDASVTFVAPLGDANDPDLTFEVSCDITNTAIQSAVEVTKMVANVTDAIDWSFDFTITPDATLSSADATAEGTGAGASTDTVVWNGLVPGATYTVAETTPNAGYTAGALTCDVADTDGDLTDASVTFVAPLGDGTSAAEVSCDITNTAIPSDVEVTKMVDGGVVVDWDFDFSIAAVPTGETSPKTASGTGETIATIGWGNLTPGETYVVTELADANSTTYVPGTLSCSDAAGPLTDGDQTADQSFTFAAPLGGDGVEISCEITNTAQSDVTWDKTVVGTPVRNADGTWTITYELEVVNADDAGAGVYDLSDTFNFGDGVSIVGGSAAVVNTAPGTITTDGGFDGVGSTTIVLGEAIAAATSHTYEVTVDVTIAVGPDTDGDCVYEPGEGSGFLNTMQISVDGGDPETTDACAGFALLTLVKDLVNDDGGNATLADFPLTAAGDPITLTGVSGTTDVSSALPVGDYALSEEVLVDGYESSTFSCVGGSLTDQTVTLVAGDNATCTVRNDDDIVDLELTKDDDGFEAIAGGDPVPYTITVENIGQRDADLGEPVTVTDVLPPGMSWNTYPAFCSESGQELTCDIDPALLGVADPAVVIDTLVDVAADAPSGTYRNRAYVTTEDDPVCEGVDCVPPPCEDEALSNNLDCEDTPVDRLGAIQITKVDDVADGDSVFAGDSYSYELAVANVGTSTILPGLVVTDDLPDQLSLVSVAGGAGWTCDDVDPIECTYAPELAPGEFAPAITVVVTVELSATGEFIDNLAEVIGAIDRDCSDALIEAFEPACNEVTDDDDERTPLIANADLAIVKTASAAQVGAGNSFSFALDVTNNGPAPAVAVVVDDLVPSQVTVTKVSSTFFSCSRIGNDVTCTRASMAVGQSGSITIDVIVPADSQADSVINIGTVQSDTPDPDLSNNSDDAEVIIVAQIPPTTAPPPTVTLPQTGSNSTSPMIQLGVLFLILGMVGVLVTRRRDLEEQAA